MNTNNSVFIANSGQFSDMEDVCNFLKKKKEYSKVIFNNTVYNIFEGDAGLTDYARTNLRPQDVMA